MDNSFTYIKPPGAYLPFAGVIWALFAGFVIGLFMTYYHKTYTGEVIRRLLKKEALSDDKAMTLGQLGLKATKPRTVSLRSGSFLRRYVSVANAEVSEIPLEKKEKGGFWSRIFPSGKKYKYDFDSMKLFIPEEKKYAADVRFEQKSRLSPVALVILAAVLMGIALAATFLLPDFVRMADNLISSVLNK